MWRGCLDQREVPTLASGLRVEESRLVPLLTEVGVLHVDDPAAQCVPYVAAVGGEGGAASAIFRRPPQTAAGEASIVDVRKTEDGITVTPGACDCTESAARRVVEFPLEDDEAHLNAILNSLPSGVAWQLDTLVPAMVAKLAVKQALSLDLTQPLPNGGPSAPLTSDITPAGTGYLFRISLSRKTESDAERLESIEIVEAGSGRRVDGAWWLDRSNAPGVLIGMDGLAYERLLWQSPIRYNRKSRGVGNQVATYYRRNAVPKGSAAKPTYRPITVREYHSGVDMTAPKGTEIHSVGDGRISFAGRSGGYGNLVIVDHGLGYETFYAHLSVIKKGMKPGVSVSRGEIVGLVGSTGRSTGAHLHFEIRKNTKYIDPFDDSRQLDFWLLSPDDQERLAIQLLAGGGSNTTRPSQSSSERVATDDPRQSPSGGR